MPARSVCLVTLSLSEAGPGRLGGQVSVTDIYHTIPLPHNVNLGLPVAFAVSTARAWPLLSVDHGPAHLNSPANTYYQTRPVITMTSSGDDTLGQGSFGTWHILPSISMVDSVACLRYAECSRAPHYITNEYGFPMQTTSCTWP